MSKVVDRFEGRQGRPPEGRPPIYDWLGWMNGEIHKLVKGEDFKGQARSFQVGAHRTAKNYNLKVHTEIIDNGGAILLEFYSPEE